MRIQIKEKELIIRLREEAAPYYDEYFCHGGNNQIAYGKRRALIFPYYSEKGELSEIHIYTSSSGEKDFYPEVEIPEKLPWRTYVFTFDYGLKSDIRKACADHYNELYGTDDRFINSIGLIVERRDGREMRPYEIKDLREAFYKDALELFTSGGAFYDWGIESVYFNRKLFFWKVEERYYPHSPEEFKNSMLEMVKAIYGEDCYLTEERVDAIDGEIWFKIVVEDGTHSIDCLANKKSFSEEELILNYGTTVKICEKLIDNAYKKQVFVFHDVLPEKEERDRLNEWTRKRGVEIKDTVEFISWFYMRKAELNDNLARENPEEWRELLAKTFRFC